MLQTIQVGKISFIFDFSKLDFFGGLFSGKRRPLEKNFFLDSGENRFFVPSSVQPKREVVNLEKKPFSFFALGFTVKMKAIGRGCFLFWPYVHFFRRVTHHLRCRITELGTSSTMRDVLMMVERLHRWRGVWFHPYPARRMYGGCQELRQQAAGYPSSDASRAEIHMC